MQNHQYSGSVPEAAEVAAWHQTLQVLSQQHCLLQQQCRPGVPAALMMYVAGQSGRCTCMHAMTLLAWHCKAKVYMRQHATVRRGDA